ncbi:hypothetical protein KIN20_023552 [Parelaphostrongylus tenuis]|uniref:Uncharacterized protein n=1 Tax=Parelaphostrongylus tenuis TaxID=148309 RepID=A0AAD5N793_PARTN|nr:hypothetical protein KIN20_023552 [Parelaphostrongylus tenuis]
MSLRPLVTVVRKEYEKQSDRCTNESATKVAECLTKADAVLWMFIIVNEDDEPLGPNEIGHLVLQSPTMMQGYLEEDE